MQEVKVGKADEHEAAVSTFIEGHRSILEDPEAGRSALSRVYVQGAALIAEIKDENIEVANQTKKAANLLTAAIKDPRCSAGKVNKREREYARLLAEHNQRAAMFEELNNFLNETKTRIDAVSKETEAPQKPVLQESPRETEPDLPKAIPLLQRLFGWRKG